MTHFITTVNVLPFFKQQLFLNFNFSNKTHIVYLVRHNNAITYWYWCAFCQQSELQPNYETVVHYHYIFISSSVQNGWYDIIKWYYGVVLAISTQTEHLTVMFIHKYVIDNSWLSMQFIIWDTVEIIFFFFFVECRDHTWAETGMIYQAGSS